MMFRETYEAERSGLASSLRRKPSYPSKQTPHQIDGVCCVRPNDAINA